MPAAPTSGRKLIQFLALSLAFSFGIESLGDFETAHKLILADAAHLAPAGSSVEQTAPVKAEVCTFSKMKALIEKKGKGKMGLVKLDSRTKGNQPERTVPEIHNMVCSLAPNPKEPKPNAS